MCSNETIARYSREHNGANVLTLGTSLIDSLETATRIVEVWLTTPMKEARYIRRLQKIRRLEERFAQD
jgi:ribose 5-phosphate isomerase B